MAVFLLLALAWVVVLVPPALRAQAARQEAFLASLEDQGGSPPAAASRPHGKYSDAVQCRRRIAGGLLTAMGVTLGAGLLPTFHVLLYVHLFLVDTFLAYIGLLAFRANRAAAAAHPRAVVVADAPEPAPAPIAKERRRRRQTVPVPVFPELGPVG